MTKLLLLNISGDGDYGTLYITVIDWFRLGDAAESVERDEDHLNGSVGTMRSRRPSEPVFGAHGGWVLLQIPWWVQSVCDIHLSKYPWGLYSAAWGLCMILSESHAGVS